MANPVPQTACAAKYPVKFGVRPARRDPVEEVRREARRAGRRPCFVFGLHLYLVYMFGVSGN